MYILFSTGRLQIANTVSKQSLVPLKIDAIAEFSVQMCL